MAALLAYAVGDESGFFTGIEEFVAQGFDMAKEPVAALQSIHVLWSKQPDLFLRLLRLRDFRVAGPLLERRRYGIPEDTPAGFHLDDVKWWSDWLTELHASPEPTLACERLGHFLAVETDESTQREIVDRFDRSPGEQLAVLLHVLPGMHSVSVDDLSPSAIEWLLSHLGTTERHCYVYQPPLAALATEDFVQQRLIPLLLEDPAEPVREELLSILRAAGVRHRRRYVDDEGDLLG
jgi:hypothetical protein